MTHDSYLESGTGGPNDCRPEEETQARELLCQLIEAWDDYCNGDGSPMGPKFASLHELIQEAKKIL